jgi:hypothetical protein
MANMNSTNNRNAPYSHQYSVSGKSVICEKEKDLLRAGDSAAEGLDIYFGVPDAFPDVVLTILPNHGGYLLPFDKLLRLNYQ